MAKNQLEFHPDIVWLQAYQRNNKSNGQKNLRCFPNHTKKEGHQRGFCGQSISVYFYHDCFKHSKISPKLLAFGNFGISAEDMQSLKISSNSNPVVSQLYHVGDIVSGEDLRSKMRTSESPLLQLLPGFETNSQRANIPGATFKTTFEFNKELKGWHYGFLGSKLTRNTWHCFYTYVVERVDEVEQQPESESFPESDIHRNKCRGSRAESQQQISYYEGTFKVVGVISSPKWQLFCRRRNRGPQARARQLCNEIIQRESNLVKIFFAGTKKNQESTTIHQNIVLPNEISSMKSSSKAKIKSERKQDQSNYLSAHTTSETTSINEHNILLKTETVRNGITRCNAKNLESSDSSALPLRHHSAPLVEKTDVFQLEERDSLKQTYRRRSSQHRLLASGRSVLCVKRHSSGMEGEIPEYSLNRHRRHTTPPESTGRIDIGAAGPSNLNYCSRSRDEYVAEKQTLSLAMLLKDVHLPFHLYSECDTNRKELKEKLVQCISLRDGVSPEMFTDRILQSLDFFQEIEATIYGYARFDVTNDVSKMKNHEKALYKFAEFLIQCGDFRLEITEFIRIHNSAIRNPLDPNIATKFTLELLVHHLVEYFDHVRYSPATTIHNTDTNNENSNDTYNLRFPSFRGFNRSLEESFNYNAAVEGNVSEQIPRRKSISSQDVAAFEDLIAEDVEYDSYNGVQNLECSPQLANLYRGIANTHGASTRAHKGLTTKNSQNQLKICNSVSSICNSAGISPTMKSNDDQMAELDLFLKSVDCVEVLETSF